MKDINYKITFYSYWHAGGKDGANKEVDNAVLKDKNNLPYIGGRTMKGLIKDGARFVNKYQPSLVSDDFIKTFFKEGDKKYEENETVENKFSSATLGFTIVKKKTHLLYHKKSNTAIEQDKQAKNSSLHTTEVTIPLTLMGRIENFTGDEKMLKLSIKAVKKLGEKRFKGLGRCKIEIIKNESHV